MTTDYREMGRSLFSQGWNGRQIAALNQQRKLTHGQVADLLFGYQDEQAIAEEMLDKAARRFDAMYCEAIRENERFDQELAEWHARWIEEHH